MAHFAKLDENNIVIDVIVVHNDMLRDEHGIECEELGVQFLINITNHINWKQTSYNSTFRKNYAGRGFVYDATRDAFIPPKPFSSWILNENTCQWEAPVLLNVSIENQPFYYWNEIDKRWDKI